MPIFLRLDRNLAQKLIQISSFDQGAQKLHLRALGILLIGKHRSKALFRLLQNEKYRHIEYGTAPSQLLKAALKIFRCIGLLGAHG